MHNWSCESKQGAEEIRSFELSGKEIFSNYDETKSKELKEKKYESKKSAYGTWSRLLERTTQVMVEARPNQSGSERGSRFRCWVRKDLTVTTKRILALLTSAMASGRKDECQVRLIGIEWQ